MFRNPLPKRCVSAALFAVLVGAIAFTTVVTVATEAEKTAAIRKGLAFLHSTQEPGGYWKSSAGEQAATGAVAYAFLSQRDKWGETTASYQATVEKAIAYLLSTASTIEVSTRKDSVNVCPGGVGTCTGVYWLGNGRSTSTTGSVVPAIALYGATVGPDIVVTTSGPLAGMTWRQIAQGITNALVAGQSTSADGNGQGGWSYSIPGNGDSDSSSTESAVVSFLYNEAFGVVTPAIVKNDLRTWLAGAQNASGAVCNQPGTEPCGTAETGGGLLAMRFVGYDLNSSQVQSALAFLNKHWRSTVDSPSESNFGRANAMWAVYKGLETTIGLKDSTRITNLLTDCKATPSSGAASSSGSCSWSDDYSQWLVERQKDNSYWTDPFAVAIYINILGAPHVPVMTNELAKNVTPQGIQARQQIVDPAAVANRAQIDSTVAPITSAQQIQAAAGSKKPRPLVRKGAIGLAVNTDGESIAGAGTDKTIRIWEATTGRERLALPPTPGLPTSLAFIPGGGALSSVGRDSVLRVWDSVSGTELAKLAGHEHAIRVVAASPNGAYLATAGEETRIMLWNLTAGKLDKILFAATHFVNALSFSPDSRLLASADEDARILIFEVASGRLLHTLRGHPGPLDALAFSPDGSLLASGGQDTTIRLWDPVKGEQKQVLTGHSAPIRSITFSPDGKLFASGGEDTRILLWNSATGQLDKVLSGSTGAINVLAFDPKGRFLASANDVGEIIQWNVIAGVKIRTITVP